MRFNPLLTMLLLLSFASPCLARDLKPQESKKLANPPESTELTPKELVKRSDDLMRGRTQEGIYSMTITTPGWERTLKLRVTSKGRMMLASSLK